MNTIDNLKEQFKKIFNKNSENVFFSPGRVNLIGEHTDYNGGNVFPCALTIGTYGLIAKREDSKCFVSSLNFENLGTIEFDLNDLINDKKHDWANYPKGVIKAFENHGFKASHGFDILFFGNIPNGSGLSSSASIEVLMGCILNESFEFNVDMVDIVKMCQEAENKFIVSSDYEVKKSNDDILSILIKYYKYSGGAHGIYEYVPYNIDLTSRNTFVLNDIFTQNSNYEQVINDEIKSQIKTLNKEQGLPEDSTQLYAFNKIKNNQKFYIKDDSIVIFFDLYEITPYVAGVPEFIIKKELINTLLIPKYKEIIFYSSKATTV